MNFKDFLNENKIYIFLFFLILIFTNTMFFIATGFLLKKSDIIYFNILLALLIFIGLFIDYKIKKYKSIKFEEDVLSDNFETNNFKHRTYLEKLIKIWISKHQINTSNKIDKLIKSSEDLDEYIGKWAHEIKIPISVINLIIERSEESEDKIKLKNEIDRVEAYVEQVIYAGKLSVSQENIYIKELFLEKIINDVIRKNKNLFIEKKIGIDIKVKDSLVISDEKWLLFIINQIINNSLKYSKEKGKIKIYIESKENSTKLFIKDNGIGIGVDEIKRVFDKGFSGKNTKIKSTGMGLYFCKKMCDKLNHKINIFSIENEFTEVSIEFFKANNLNLF